MEGEPKKEGGGGGDDDGKGRVRSRERRSAAKASKRRGAVGRSAVRAGPDKRTPTWPRPFQGSVFHGSLCVCLNDDRRSTLDRARVDSSVFGSFSSYFILCSMSFLP